MRRRRRTWQELNAWPGLDTGSLTLDEIRQKVRGTAPLRPEHVGEVLQRMREKGELPSAENE